jgi:Replication-relaxation
MPPRPRLARPANTSTRADRSRLVVNAALSMRIASRLIDRDRRILRLVAHHRVLTTDQLARVFFSSPTTARHRLAELYRLRLLDRFRPIRPRWHGDGLGSEPFHWVLDEAGAMVLTAEHDEDLSKFHWKRKRRGDEIALAASQQLDHLVAVNEVFTRLLAAQRAGAGELEVWWNQAETAGACADAYGRAVVRPDCYGVWHQDGGELPFWVEVDLGTETHYQLRAKLEGYAEVEIVRQVVTWVLFIFATPGREAAVRAALVGRTTVPVATAVLWPHDAPHGAVWLPLDSQGPRLRLIDLANLPVRPEAIERATSIKRWAEEERQRQEANKRMWEQSRAEIGDE